MAYETKDLSGSLFKNDRKENENHADYRGSARIDGHDYWINSWVNKDKNGNSYMKLTFKRKDGTAARPGRNDNDFGKSPPVEKTGRATAGDILDDSVPFAPEFR